MLISWQYTLVRTNDKSESILLWIMSHQITMLLAIGKKFSHCTYFHLLCTLSCNYFKTKTFISNCFCKTEKSCECSHDILFIHVSMYKTTCYYEVWHGTMMHISFKIRLYKTYHVEASLIGETPLHYEITG